MKVTQHDVNKRILRVLAGLLCLVLLSGCGRSREEMLKEGEYEMITAVQAKDIMNMQTGYVILDVRTPDEYREGHIPDAVLLPDYEIGKQASEVLKDKNQLILVYCRSGNRSKKAAAQLVSMGYTNVKEFGGIIDWPYEVQTD